LAEIEAAVEQVSHFILDGWGDIFSVFRYGLVAEYKSSIVWGTTVEKALKAVITDTSKLVELWAAIRMGLLDTLLKNPKDMIKHGNVIQTAMKTLNQMQSFIDDQIFPLINNGVSPLLVMQKWGVAAEVNHWRIKKNLPTVPWDGVDFLHDYRKFGSTEEKKALILATLCEDTKQTFAPLFQANYAKSAIADKKIRNDTKKDRNGLTVKCYTCGENHYQSKCPEKLKEQLKTLRANKSKRKKGALGKRTPNKRNWEGMQAQHTPDPNYYAQFEQPIRRFRPSPTPNRFLGNNGGNNGGYNGANNNNNGANNNNNNGGYNGANNGSNGQNAAQRKGKQRYIHNNGRYSIHPQNDGGTMCKFFEKTERDRNGQLKHCYYESDFARCRWLHYCTNCGLANGHTTAECPNAGQNRF